MSVAYNADCMEIMRQYPDKYFNLAVVDPPYGSGGGTFVGGDGTRTILKNRKRLLTSTHLKSAWTYNFLVKEP